VAGIFSQHVAALTAGSAVDVAILDEVKNVLRFEMRHRGIADYGPSLLGYLGKSWYEGDALDDLAQDCYLRAIASRLRGLRANLQQSGDIENLVRKNIRTFIGERQAKFDPAGYAIFQNIKAVVLNLSELGVLKRLDAATDPISGSSQFEVLQAVPGEFPEESALKAALKQTGKLMHSLEAQYRVSLGGQEALAEAIRLLPGESVGRFRVSTLKKAVQALLAEAGIRPNFARGVAFSGLKTEFFEKSRTESGKSGYEETESYEQLLATIRQAIDDLPRSAKVRARLQALLAHLAEAISSGDSDRLQSLDDLADQFGVPRSTLHDDFQSLRSLVSRLVKASPGN
jgi:hypothetical protein